MLFYLSIHNFILIRSINYEKLIKFYDWDGSVHLLKEDNKKVIESIPIVDRKGHIINDMKKISKTLLENSQ